MTFVDQIKYINRIKDEVSKSGNYRFETHSQLQGYLLIEKKSDSCIMRIERLNLREIFNVVCFNSEDKEDINCYVNCSLEDFLSNYFGDIINPTPEEKVMWKLQFGFDWIVEPVK